MHLLLLSFRESGLCTLIFSTFGDAIVNVNFMQDTDRCVVLSMEKFTCE